VRLPEQGHEVGGLGIGTRNSLAQYLAGELSRRIKSGDLATVEGAFAPMKTSWSLFMPRVMGEG
jgi:hypothetical protein